MLQFNLTLVLVFLSFLVFMGLMKTIYFDPVARIKILREQKIKLDQISLEELQQDLNDLTKRLNYQMSESHRRAQQILMETTATAKTEAAHQLHTLRESLSEQHANHAKQLHQLMDSTLAALQAHKEEFVTELIQALNKPPLRYESGVN